MKFGKRLLAEGARSRFGAAFFDYKAVKKAIKDDIHSKDVQGGAFQRILVEELHKVSQYYSERAAASEATFSVCQQDSSPVRAQTLTELRADVQELIKYVALNYLAVVKAIKKRNRHLQEAFGAAANTSLHALDLLVGEIFFTSPRLAGLATQAEVLYRELQSPHASLQLLPAASKQLLEEYTCPVCLDTLHNPVVLTCAHRFCWGCLVAHCTTHRDSSLCADPKDDLAAVTSYRVLEKLATEPESPAFFPCPVCRKPQLLDIDTLQVDSYLEQFIENLEAISNVTVSPPLLSTSPAPATATLPARDASTAHQELSLMLGLLEPVLQQRWGIIAPQPAEHQGKLCVMLDLDGTLVSSFTPKRAPRLPAYVRTHIVGMGSKLNPQGVYVVERPGLSQFLEELAQFAEVIVFTAGLEDYASPIIDAIDPHNRLFTQRIYREGTLRTEHYQCVKDMARVNRDLKRVVLVDDTPLAFLHQPDNGVPVLGFRGDPDDRLLLEAVLPLLQALAVEEDVQPVLHRRFGMGSWFKRHGFAVEYITSAALKAAEVERELNMLKPKGLVSAKMDSTPSISLLFGVPVPVPRGHMQQALLPMPVGGSKRTPLAAPVPTRTCLVMDFDRSLMDWDTGERVVEHLAPELLPMLVGQPEGPCNFIPITNTLLAELQRRGVSRDQLITTLHELGANEMPAAMVHLLKLVQERGADTRILSDCNSVFISHILAGAHVGHLVQEVITNPAAFERVEGAVEGGPAGQATQGAAGSPSGQRMKVYPKYGAGAGGRAPHSCPLCPQNMCKGNEVRAIRQAGKHKRIVYVGDGSNDVCAALALGPGDVVLARTGFPLAKYLQAAEANVPGTCPVLASCGSWSSHEELSTLAQQAMGHVA